LPIVPDRNPRTECGCHRVAFCSSFDVAPPGRFSRSRIFAALLPSRAPVAFFSLLGAFLAGLAFLPGFPFFGATFARRAPAVAFFVGFGSADPAVGAVSICSVFVVIIRSPLAVITAVTTWITPKCLKSKPFVRQIDIGEEVATVAGAGRR
jgi:hypothetical protein